MHTFESAGGNCSIAAWTLFWIARRSEPFVAAAPAFGGIARTFASTYACKIPVTASPPTPHVPANFFPDAIAVAVSCLAVLIEYFAFPPLTTWIFGYFFMTF